MRYYMKSKIFKIKEDFWIKNEYDEDVYFVDNKLLTFGLQFDILRNNHLVYSVKEKLLKFLPSYVMIENGKTIAQINKNISFFKDKINVSSKYGDLTIEGDYFDYSYQIYLNKRCIAQITKKLMAFSDSYYVDVDFEDEAFVLALVVIIDNIIDKKENN